MDKITPEILNIDPNTMDVKSHEFLALANQSIKSQTISTGATIMQTANQWIDTTKNTPFPKMLFSEFWFEGELCILFADTNLGKSILAVQIGNSISTGEPIENFKLELPKQPIIYLDCELNARQFALRYSESTQNGYCTGHYNWDDNFYRLELNNDSEIDKETTFESQIFSSLESQISLSGIKTVIIDNITYLSAETEKARDAMPLMKKLKELKSKYDLSLLVLAHTPKRDLSKPLDRNDLQGSKHLINFCDSAFAIGESTQDKSLRYLKQIKCRNTEIVYDSENVSICEISKPDNFLMFTQIALGDEREHLREKTSKEDKEFKETAFKLREEGLSYQAIADQLGTNKMKICRLIQK